MVSGLSVDVNGLEEEFKGLGRHVCARSAVRDATSTEAKKKKSIRKHASKVGQSSTRNIAYSCASYPGLSSTFGCSFPMLFIGRHILVSEPKHIHDNIGKNVGLTSHHTVANVVSATNKKRMILVGCM